ncbi:OLC1v1006432C1 [Oldenlandia corymbosa var. corymbosa]|uniref:OLC1v1006432C1 n=1 Tax=Oldenlandia corymbosa var. corymbosa TaxID=529605 RepID=A0AAV1DH12_OLDCO|nr:OLC1v1006432C1 [Oldenlandia corymbosa var. corymbosa]
MSSDIPTFAIYLRPSLHFTSAIFFWLLLVFSYGSVPLKTYLPDGDIDLTILCWPRPPATGGSWAADVLSVFQKEENDENAEFVVKDAQFIDAEVKIVKCIVANIVIDISFNQFGGLCTLCFLEKVDRLIGKDHLFKRSIILIKTWCYYESRILGAHHGLLSTYAVETLILYIFHLFHSSLDGPLAVLYKFLDYFSKFDWDNYCVSLKGPVYKSSLPKIVAQMPQEERSRFLLSEDFLANCMEIFAMQSPDQETNPRLFCPKNLNIIDPLKEYNNLGRSVHRGNFYRIRSAFRYGARKLGRVLSLPKDEIAHEIRNFFSNTLRRHERMYGFRMQDSAQVLHPGVPITSFSAAAAVSSEAYTYMTSSNSQNHAPSQIIPGLSYPVKEALSGYNLIGDACDLAKNSYVDFRTSNATSDSSPTSDPSFSSLGQFIHVPQLKLSNSTPKSCCGQIDACDAVGDKFVPDTCFGDGGIGVEMVDTSQSSSDSSDGYGSCSSAVSTPKSNSSETLSFDFREDLGDLDDGEPINPLADLTGDYDSHIRSLLHGPFLHKLALSEFLLPCLPMSPQPQSQNQNSWHPVHQSMPLEQHSFSQTSSTYTSLTHAASSYAPFFPASASEDNQRPQAVHQSVPPEKHSFSETNWTFTSVKQAASSLSASAPAFSSEESKRPRGTGTYLPMMMLQDNYTRDGPYQRWDRLSSSWSHSRRQYSNGYGHDSTYSQVHLSAKGGRENFHARGPVPTQKKSSGISSQSNCGKEYRNRANGISNSLQKIEFGSIGRLVDGVISTSCNVSALVTNSHLNSSSSFEKVEEKVADEPLCLMNEAEFPPLSI